MPSKQWMAERRQLKIWVSVEELDALRLAARRRDRSMTEMIRDALAPLLRGND